MRKFLPFALVLCALCLIVAPGSALLAGEGCSKDKARAAAGGDIYVPTPEEKAAFKEAAAPVYDWFKANIEGGERIFEALTSAVAEAEADLEAALALDPESVVVALDD